MNLKPARKIRPTKGPNYRCKISRSKNLSIVHSESLLERDFVKMCNFDSSILEIYFQPYGIRYHYKGIRRRYFPDYLLLTKDGRYLLVEVKLKKYTDTDLNKAKFIVGQEFCRERNWTYHVVTEDQVRPGFFQRNLSLLLEVKCHESNPVVTEYIQTVLQFEGPLSIQDLRKKCSLVDGPTLMINLYKLIYTKTVHTDLISRKLSDDSSVWVS
jgi:hypothetical protein